MPSTRTASPGCAGRRCSGRMNRSTAAPGCEIRQASRAGTGDAGGAEPRHRRCPVDAARGVRADTVTSPMKEATKRSRRPAIDLLGRIDLADAALRHHGEPVGQAQRLALVMGHEHGGDAELALDLLHLDLHRGAQILVERGERLVEQQHLRTDHQSARQRHALLLAARQLPRLAVLEPGELHQRQDVGRRACAISALATPRVLRP